MSMTSTVALAVPPAVSSQAVPSDAREFYRVGGNDLEKIEVLSEIFKRILTPLYGPQDKALQQIRESKDRQCFLLYEGKIPAGVLVFKTVLSDEFAEFGVEKSIEIKSLFVDQSAQNSGRGLGSCLVDKVKHEVEKLKLGQQGIHVTVSETKQESLMFFQKKGFSIVHAWDGRYQPGTREFLLSCPTLIQENRKRPAPPEINPAQASTSQSSKRSVAELVHVIHRAHLDDIHALKKLSDGTFVSGSKDNCLYKWSREGKLVRVIDEVQPTQQNERNWITAVEVFNEEYWFSGERNGKVNLWNTQGDFVREIKLKLPQGGHVSLEHNIKRVACIATGVNPSRPTFFVGFPTMFDEFNFIDGRTTFSTKVHKNDWVYCIHPLSDKSALIVTGGKVDQWVKNDTGWEFGKTLIVEGKRYKTLKNNSIYWQRPFISSLRPLNDHLYGLSLFDGSVKVFDMKSESVVSQWTEHKGRVWSIEKVDEQMFASSSEDRCIKLWDLREKKSVHTIVDHVGEVTSLLSFDKNTLIAGTCPANPIVQQLGAEIRFYDIRK